MALVRVKDKYQVTIPNEVREGASLSVGDYLDARIGRGGVITLTPQSFVDRAIAAGLADLRAGRTHGPFDTVEEVIASLKGKTRRDATTKAKKRTR